MHTEMQNFRDLENNTIFFATRNSDRRSEQSPARRTKPGPNKARLAEQSRTAVGIWVAKNPVFFCPSEIGHRHGTANPASKKLNANLSSSRRKSPHRGHDLRLNSGGAQSEEGRPEYASKRNGGAWLLGFRRCLKLPPNVCPKSKKKRTHKVWPKATPKCAKKLTPEVEKSGPKG